MPAAVKKTVDRLLTLARAATDVMSRNDTIPHGAPVSRTQFTAVETHLKKKNVLKYLACTEKTLKSYARNEISHAQLPAKTQERLSEVNASYAKPWSRKSAAIAYVVHTERKKSSRKRARKSTPTVESTESA